MPGRPEVNTGNRFIFCPVNPFSHRGFGIQLYAAQYPLSEAQITSLINEMSHMEVNRFTSQNFFLKFKQIGDDLSDDILSNLVQENFPCPWRFFTGSSPQTNLPELLRLTLPGEGGAGQNTFAAPDTERFFLCGFSVL